MQIPRLFDEDTEVMYRASEDKERFPTDDEILICDRNMIFYNPFNNTLILYDVRQTTMSAYKGALRGGVGTSEDTAKAKSYASLGVFIITQDKATGYILLGMRRNIDRQPLSFCELEERRREKRREKRFLHQQEI